ncbi:MAG: AAA family ATPase [Aquisalimonadaceae bacterium]
MYLEHFRLKDHPFRLTPDQDFFYMGHGHARAKAYMDYTVVSRDGFVVITGEIGAGKTTLLNKIIAEMSEDVVLAHINQSRLSDVEFLQAVVSAFGMDIANAGKVELLNRLRSFLQRQFEADRRVVLAVDEAQSLGYPVLEEIRQLVGSEADKSKLISVILMGQPELRDLINSPQMEQLSQRVRLRFHLGPLTREEVRKYIRHRLRVARAVSGDLFADGAYDAIYRYAGGIPRLINSLCDMAMLTAFVDNQFQVSAAIVKQAAEELDWPLFEERQAAMRRQGVAPPSTDGGQADREINVADISELAKAFTAGIHGVADAMDGLRKDLQAIDRRLEELAKRLERR